MVTVDREDSICFLLFEMRYHSSAATVVKALHRHYDESSHGGNNVSEREDQENGGPGRIKRASFSFFLTRQSSIYNLNDKQSNLASIYQVGACFHLDVFHKRCPSSHENYWHHTFSLGLGVVHIRIYEDRFLTLVTRPHLVMFGTERRVITSPKLQDPIKACIRLKVADDIFLY